VSRAILYDSSMCIGCRECEKACAARWKLPYNEAIAAEEQISAHKLTAIQTHGTHYSRRLCMHCADPTCASVCPVGALKKTSLGPVVYDPAKCIGCRYCMLACPFQVPTYEWQSRLPTVRKCDMCYERVSQGKPTACAEACPTGATVCGDRDGLILEARRRIREKPDQYYGRIYGVEEVGGTSVLFLSPVPFGQLGIPTNLPKTPLPMLTWKVLSRTPDIASVAGVLLGGVYWITHRREKVAAEEGDGNHRGKK